MGDAAAPAPPPPPPTPPPPPPPLRFTCALCGYESHVNYVGRTPPFNRSVVYLEEAYVIRNPGNGDPNRPLCLGSACVVCERIVCAGPSCSIFFTKRLCTDCCKRSEVAAQLPAGMAAAKPPPAARERTLPADEPGAKRTRAKS